MTQRQAPSPREMKGSANTSRPKVMKMPKHQTKAIMFDDKARHEYLTGFHKRKVAKKKEMEEKRKRLAREELRARRREKRGRLQRAVDNVVAAMKLERKESMREEETRVVRIDGRTSSTVVVTEPLCPDDL